MKTLKIIGITVVAAGLLYYPALKLYQYLASKRQETGEEDENKEDFQLKTVMPAYRGKNKAHNRRSHNGHHN